MGHNAIGPEPTSSEEYVCFTIPLTYHSYQFRAGASRLMHKLCNLFRFHIPPFWNVHFHASSPGDKNILSKLCTHDRHLVILKSAFAPSQNCILNSHYVQNVVSNKFVPFGKIWKFVSISASKLMHNPTIICIVHFLYVMGISPLPKLGESCVVNYQQPLTEWT